MRRITATAFVLAGLLLATASAASEHTYVATATATGMRIGFAEAGQNLTIGFTEAGVQSGPSEACGDEQVACAAAAAALEPFGTTTTAHAPGDEGPHAEAGFEIPEGLAPLLGGGLGTGTAEAAGAPNPRGQGDAAVSRITLTATQTFFEEAEPLREGLQELSDQVLGPIAEGDPSGEVGPRLKGVVDQIISGETPLATIDVGPSRSVTETADGMTSAQGRSSGTVIALAPLPEHTPAAPAAFVIVEVGQAVAHVTSDQLTATADSTPAIVSLRFFNPDTLEYESVEISPGQGGCGGEAPLVVCVQAATAEEEVDGAAAVARASAVAIQLLDEPAPQIVIELAVAEATVSAAPPPPAAPAPEPEPALPRTGLAIPLLPAVLVLGAGLAGYGLLHRRR